MSFKCPACGSIETGRSPTGDWCNLCGWQNPCPCWQGRKNDCGVHNRHEHIWDKNGCCIAMEGCAAKLKYNEGGLI